MWKNINKIIIFSLLIGLSALCYAQIIENVEPKENFVSTTAPASSSSSHVTDAKLIQDDNADIKTDDDVDKKKHKTTTTTTTMIPTTISTTEQTTTTTTTAKPTTTTAEPTSTTTKSTTTTIKPTATTEKTTTTERPTTTSTTTMKPTPKPTPTPKPKPGIWSCNCIQLQMVANVQFNYTTKDNKTMNASVSVPDTAMVHDCECDKPEIQNIVLQWGPEPEPNSMTIQFEKNSGAYGLSMILLKLNTFNLLDAKLNETQLIYYNRTFVTPVQMSYHCTRQQKLHLIPSINSVEPIGIISLMDLQFEAFHPGNSTWKFSTAKDCDAADTQDIVPIAAGIALILLIIIILVSYLVARRRSLSRGYVSF